MLAFEGGSELVLADPNEGLVIAEQKGDPDQLFALLYSQHSFQLCKVGGEDTLRLTIAKSACVAK